ncbi:accelerated cell death 1, partial [Dunaliella salina]
MLKAFIALCTLLLQFDLLGLSLVVWADSKGSWSCQEDKCPHRLAPLSEGRIEGDALQCSYHGWKFNCRGACIQIPQIDDPKAQSTALASPRARVQ